MAVARLFWVIVSCLSLSTHVCLGQGTECNWSNLPPCNDAWINFTTPPFWVQLQTSPPCSVRVQAFGRRRCNQVEINDWKWFFAPTSPPSCMSRDDIMSLFSLLYKLSSETLLRNLFLSDFVNGTPLCPENVTYFIAKPGSCMKRTLNWSIPGGGSYSVEYDPLQSWSYYDSLMASTQGSGMYASVMPCNEICCRRELTFCYLPDGSVQMSGTYWSPVPQNVCNPVLI